MGLCKHFVHNARCANARYAKCLHRPIVIINQQYTKGEIHFHKYKQNVMWYTTCGIYTVSLALQRLAKQIIYKDSVFDMQVPDINAKTYPFLDLVQLYPSFRALFRAEDTALL